MAATAVAVTSGHVLLKLLSSAAAGWLGSLIIIGIGIATLLTSARTPRPAGSADTPVRGWRHLPHVGGVISWREAIVLGVALSLNNLGTGVGAGVAGIPALATTLSAGLLSLGCVGGGSHFGEVLGRLALGRHAPLIAGMLLLAVGAAMHPNVA